MLNSVICLARPLTDVSLKSCCSRAGACLRVTSRPLRASALFSDLHDLAACKITKSLARSYASTGPFRLDVAGASLVILPLLTLVCCNFGSRVRYLPVACEAATDISE